MWLHWKALISLRVLANYCFRKQWNLCVLANSKCERQRALFQDAINIRNGNLQVPGFTTTEMRAALELILGALDDEFLPLLNCTSDGNFAPVQCSLNLSTNKTQCYCTNAEGIPLSSNVMAYPGFPPCTGNNSLLTRKLLF